MKLRPRFRLSSMMVVVGVVAVVLWGVGTVGEAREAARRAQCANNLKQIGLAVHNYLSANGDLFPSAALSNPTLPVDRRLSWFVGLWPYVEQLFWIFDMTKAWDDDANRVTRARGIEDSPSVVKQVYVLTCPSHPHLKPDAMPGLTHYVGIAGVGKDAPTLPVSSPRAGVFGYERHARFDDIKDGTSNTMMVVETTINGPWTAGGSATLRALDPAQRPYVGKGRPFGGMHPGGVNVLLVDGSVRFVRTSVDPRAFEALATIAGGERLGDGRDR